MSHTTPPSRLQKQAGAPARMRAPKISQRIAENLRSQIVAGRLKPGDHLPSENDLLALYRISRPTLREALRVLESESLISLGRGARTGALVLEPSVHRVAEYSAVVLAMGEATFADLHEARLFLEPPIIRAIVENRDRKFIAQLRACVAAEIAAFGAGAYDEALAAINRFHELLLGASGNPVLILVVNLLHILSNRTSALLLGGSERNKAALRKNMEKTIAGHRLLARLMSQGKAAEAEIFWRSYMQRALDFLHRTRLGKLPLTR